MPVEKKYMGHLARLVGNSSWNGLSFLVGAGLNLLILPFVISHLGISEFGLAALIVACVAPALIFSSAFTQIVTRELAQYQEQDRQDEARRVFATALFIALVIGTAIVLLQLLIGPWLTGQIFNLEPGQFNHIFLCFVFGIIGWFFQCISGLFLAILTARQEYGRVAKISICSALTSAFLLWLLIPMWPEAATYLACQAAGFAFGLVAAFLISHYAFSDYLSRPKLYFETLQRIFSIGSWQFAAQACGVIAGQVDRYILGALMQTRYVGYYNVAQRLEEAVYIGVLKVGEVLFPFFSSFVQENDERKADVLFRASWVLNLLAVCTLGSIIPIAGPLLKLWTNADVAREGELVLIALALAGILGCGTNVFSFFLLGGGKTRINAMISLATAVVISVSSSVGLYLLGWKAAGWSACAGMAVQMFLVVIYMRRSFSVKDSSHRILHLVLAPLAFGAMAALIIRLLLQEFLIHGMTVWWQVVIWYLLSAAMVGCTVVIIAKFGPYGEVCLGDLKRIGLYLLPKRLS